MAEIITGYQIDVFPSSQSHTRWAADNDGYINWRPNDESYVDATGVYQKKYSYLYEKQTNTTLGEKYRLIYAPSIYHDGTNLVYSNNPVWQLQWKPTNSVYKQLARNVNSSSYPYYSHYRGEAYFYGFGNRDVRAYNPGVKYAAIADQNYKDYLAYAKSISENEYNNNWDIAGNLSFPSIYNSAEYQAFNNYASRVSAAGGYIGADEASYFEQIAATEREQLNELKTQIADELSDWIILFRQETPEESDAGFSSVANVFPDEATWVVYNGRNRAFIADKPGSIQITEQTATDTNTTYNPNNPIFAGEIFYTATKPPLGTTSFSGETYTIGPNGAPASGYKSIPKGFFVERNDIQGDVITYIPPLVQSEIEKPIRALAVMEDVSGNNSDLILRQSIKNEATNFDRAKRVPSYVTSDIIADPVGYDYIDVPVPFSGFTDNTVFTAISNSPDLFDSPFDSTPLSDIAETYFPVADSPRTALFTQNMYCRYPKELFIIGTNGPEGLEQYDRYENLGLSDEFVNTGGTGNIATYDYSTHPLVGTSHYASSYGGDFIQSLLQSYADGAPAFKYGYAPVDITSASTFLSTNPFKKDTNPRFSGELIVNNPNAGDTFTATEFEFTLDPGSTQKSGGAQFVSRRNPTREWGNNNPDDPKFGSPYFGNFNQYNKRHNCPNGVPLNSPNLDTVVTHLVPSVIEVKGAGDRKQNLVNGSPSDVGAAFDSPFRNFDRGHRNDPTKCLPFSSRYNGYYFRYKNEETRAGTDGTIAPAWYKKYDLTTDKSGAQHDRTLKQIQQPKSGGASSNTQSPYGSYPATATEDIRIVYDSPFFYMRDYSLKGTSTQSPKNAEHNPYHNNDSRHNANYTNVYKCRGYRSFPSNSPLGAANSPGTLPNNFPRPVYGAPPATIELGVPKTFSWDAIGELNASHSTTNNISTFDVDTLPTSTGVQGHSWYSSSASDETNNMYAGTFSITVDSSSKKVTAISFTPTAANGNNCAFWVGQQVRITGGTMNGFKFYIAEVRNTIDRNIGNRHQEGWMGCLEAGDITADLDASAAPDRENRAPVNVYPFGNPPHFNMHFGKVRNNIMHRESTWNFSTGKFDFESHGTFQVNIKNGMYNIGTRRTAAGKDFLGRAHGGNSPIMNGSPGGGKNNYKTDGMGFPFVESSYNYQTTGDVGKTASITLNLVNDWNNGTHIFTEDEYGNVDVAYKYDLNIKTGIIPIGHQFSLDTFSNIAQHQAFNEYYFYSIVEARDKTTKAVVDSMSGYFYLGTSGDLDSYRARRETLINNENHVKQYNYKRNDNAIVKFDHKSLVIPRNRILLGGGLNPAPGNHLGGSIPATVKEFKLIQDGKTVGDWRGILRESTFRLALSKDRAFVSETPPDNTITITCTTYAVERGQEFEYEIVGDRLTDNIDIDDFIGLSSLKGKFVMDGRLQDSIVLTINPDKKREGNEQVRVQITGDQKAFTIFTIKDDSQPETFVLSSSPGQDIAAFTVTGHSSPKRNGTYYRYDNKDNSSPNAYNNSPNSGYQVVLAKDTQGGGLQEWEWLWRDNRGASGSTIFGGAHLPYGQNGRQGSPGLYGRGDAYTSAYLQNPALINWQSKSAGLPSNAGFDNTIIRDHQSETDIRQLYLSGFEQIGKSTTINHFPRLIESTPPQEINVNYHTLSSGRLSVGSNQLTKNVNGRYIKSNNNRYINTTNNTEIVKPLIAQEEVLSQIKLSNFGTFALADNVHKDLMPRVSGSIFNNKFQQDGLFWNWLLDFVENGYRDPLWHLKYPVKAEGNTEDFPFTVDIGPIENLSRNQWYPELIIDIANDYDNFISSYSGPESDSAFAPAGGKDYFIWGLLNVPKGVPSYYNGGFVVHPDLQFRNLADGTVSGHGHNQSHAQNILNLICGNKLPPSGLHLKKYEGKIVLPIQATAGAPNDIRSLYSEDGDPENLQLPLLSINYKGVQFQSGSRVYQRISETVFRGIPTKDELVSFIGPSATDAEYLQYISETDLYQTAMSEIWQIELESESLQEDRYPRWVINVYTKNLEPQEYKIKGVSGREDLITKQNVRNTNLNRSESIYRSFNNYRNTLCNYHDPLMFRSKVRIYQDSNNTITSQFVSPDRVVWEMSKDGIAVLEEEGLKYNLNQEDVIKLNNLGYVGDVDLIYSYIIHDVGRWTIRDNEWPYNEYYQDEIKGYNSDVDIRNSTFEPTYNYRTFNTFYTPRFGGTLQLGNRTQTTHYGFERDYALQVSLKNNQEIYSVGLQTLNGDYYRGFEGFPQADDTRVFTVATPSLQVIELMERYVKEAPQESFQILPTIIGETGEQTIYDDPKYVVAAVDRITRFRNICDGPGVPEDGIKVYEQKKPINVVKVYENPSDGVNTFKVNLNTTGVQAGTNVVFNIDARSAEDPPRFATVSATNEDIYGLNYSPRVGLSSITLRGFGVNTSPENTIRNANGEYILVSDSPIKYAKLDFNTTVTEDGSNGTINFAKWLLRQNSPREGHPSFGGPFASPNNASFDRGSSPNKFTIYRNTYGYSGLTLKKLKEDPGRNVSGAVAFQGDAFRSVPPYIDISLGETTGSFLSESSQNYYQYYNTQSPSLLDKLSVGQYVKFLNKDGSAPTGTLAPFATSSYKIIARPRKNVIRIGGFNSPSDTRKTSNPYSGRQISRWENLPITETHKQASEKQLDYREGTATSGMATSAGLRGKRRARLHFGELGEIPDNIKNLKVGSQVKFYYKAGDTKLDIDVREYFPNNAKYDRATADYLAGRGFQLREGSIVPRKDFRYKWFVRTTSQGGFNEPNLADERLTPTANLTALYKGPVFRKGDPYRPTPLAVGTGGGGGRNWWVPSDVEPRKTVKTWEFMQLDQFTNIYTVLDIAIDANGQNYIELEVPLESDIATTYGVQMEDTAGNIIKKIPRLGEEYFYVQEERFAPGRHDIYPHIGMYLYEYSEVIPQVETLDVAIAVGRFAYFGGEVLGPNHSTSNETDSLHEIYGSFLPNAQTDDEGKERYKSWPRTEQRYGTQFGYIMPFEELSEVFNEEVHARTTLFENYNIDPRGFGNRSFNPSYQRNFSVFHMLPGWYTYDPKAVVTLPPSFQDPTTWDRLTPPTGFFIPEEGQELGLTLDNGTMEKDGNVVGFFPDFMDLYHVDENPNDNWTNGTLELFNQSDFEEENITSTGNNTPVDSPFFYYNKNSPALDFSNASFVNTTGANCPNPGIILQNDLIQKTPRRLQGSFKIDGSPGAGSDSFEFRVNKDNNIVEGNEIFTFSLDSSQGFECNEIDFQLVNDGTITIPDSPRYIENLSPSDAYTVFNNNLFWNDTHSSPGVTRTAIGVVPVSDPTGGTGLRDPSEHSYNENVILYANNDYTVGLPIVSLSGEYTVRSFPDIHYKYRQFDTVEQITEFISNAAPGFRSTDVLSLYNDTHDRVDSPAHHKNEHPAIRATQDPSLDPGNTTFQVVIADTDIINRQSPEIITIAAEGFINSNSPIEAWNLNNSTFYQWGPYPNPLQSNPLFYGVNSPVFYSQDNHFKISKSGDAGGKLIIQNAVHADFEIKKDNFQYAISDGGTWNGSYSYNNTHNGTELYKQGNKIFQIYVDEKYRRDEIDSMIDPKSIRMTTTGFTDPRLNTTWMLVDARGAGNKSKVAMRTKHPEEEEDGFTSFRTGYYYSAPTSSQYNPPEEKQIFEEFPNDILMNSIEARDEYIKAHDGNGSNDRCTNLHYGTVDKRFKHHHWIPVNWSSFPYNFRPVMYFSTSLAYTSLGSDGYPKLFDDGFSRSVLKKTGYFYTSGDYYHPEEHASDIAFEARANYRNEDSVVVLENTVPSIAFVMRNLFYDTRPVDHVAPTLARSQGVNTFLFQSRFRNYSIVFSKIKVSEFGYLDYFTGQEKLKPVSGDTVYTQTGMPSDVANWEVDYIIDEEDPLGSWPVETYVKSSSGLLFDQQNFSDYNQENYRFFQGYENPDRDIVAATLTTSWLTSNKIAPQVGTIEKAPIFSELWDTSWSQARRRAEAIFDHTDQQMEAPPYYIPTFYGVNYTTQVTGIPDAPALYTADSPNATILTAKWSDQSGTELKTEYDSEDSPTYYAGFNLKRYSGKELIKDYKGYGWPLPPTANTVFDITVDNTPSRIVPYQVAYQIERISELGIVTNEIELVQYNKPVFNTVAQGIGRELRAYVNIDEPSAAESGDDVDGIKSRTGINSKYDRINGTLFETPMDEFGEKYKLELLIDPDITSSPYAGTGLTLEDRIDRYTRNAYWNILKVDANGDEYVLHKQNSPAYTVEMNVAANNYPTLEEVREDPSGYSSDYYDYEELYERIGGDPYWRARRKINGSINTEPIGDSYLIFANFQAKHYDNGGATMAINELRRDMALIKNLISDSPWPLNETKSRFPGSYGMTPIGQSPHLWTNSPTFGRISYNTTATDTYQQAKTITSINLHNFSPVL